MVAVKISLFLKQTEDIKNIINANIYENLHPVI